MKSKQEFEKWLEKAEKDVNTARANLGIDEYEASAFFSHQAAEKALKALYILKFKRLWKTHDLEQLAVKLKAEESIARLCAGLNPHYIATRYATEIQYKKEDAEKALKTAEKVVEWIKKQIK